MEETLFLLLEEDEPIGLAVRNKSEAQEWAKQSDDRKLLEIKVYNTIEEYEES